MLVKSGASYEHRHSHKKREEKKQLKKGGRGFFELLMYKAIQAQGERPKR